MKKIIIGALIVATSGIAAYSFAGKAEDKKEEIIKTEKAKLVEDAMKIPLRDVSSAD